MLDYDDLLLYWAQMVSDRTGRGTRPPLPHVLVDEYQDTNPLQAAILLAMKPDGRGLTVVGDDAQSIYRFRGATVRNILDYPGHFDPPAQVIALERNYRSTRPILAAANAVIAEDPGRFTQDLWSERAAAQAGADHRARRGGPGRLRGRARPPAARTGRGAQGPGRIFRSASHSVRLEIELTRRNIPFVKFGGLKFLEARHVKDILALLRWAQNLRDRVSIPGAPAPARHRAEDRQPRARQPAGGAARVPAAGRTARAGEGRTGMAGIRRAAGRAGTGRRLAASS